MQPLEPGVDPECIGDFVLLGLLGAGGFGRVYLGRSPGGVQVAVKIVHQLVIDSHPSFRARFRREVEAIGRVGGFWTPSLLGSDADADRPWYAMQFVDAPTLSEVVERDGVLDLDRALALGRDLAKALTVVHAVDLVHRDLKPSNVLMAPDRPRLIDFGIALLDGGTRITRTGAAPGTIGYLSYEQLEGRPATAASDVFALGALLVFATSGHLPFPGGTEIAVYHRMSGPPDLTGVPRDLHAVLRRCLAVDPERRPSPAELLATFERAPCDSPGPAATVTPTVSSRRTRVETAPEPARTSTGDGVVVDVPDRGDGGRESPPRPEHPGPEAVVRAIREWRRPHAPPEPPDLPEPKDPRPFSTDADSDTAERPVGRAPEIDESRLAGVAGLVGGIVGAQLYWLAGLPWWGALLFGFVAFGLVFGVLDDLGSMRSGWRPEDVVGAALGVPALLAAVLAGVVTAQQTSFSWWQIGLVALAGCIGAVAAAAGAARLGRGNIEEPLDAATSSSALVVAMLLFGLLVWVVELRVWQALLLSGLTLLVLGPVLVRLVGDSHRPLLR